MEITNLYANGYAGGNPYIAEALALNAQQNASAQGSSKSSGDSIQISDEARQMLASLGSAEETAPVLPESGQSSSDALAQSIGQNPAAPAEGTTQMSATPSDTAGQNGTGQYGTQGNSAAANNKEFIEAQLTSLIAQLSSMPLGDPRATAVSSQIAGLQAQLSTFTARYA